MLKSESRCELTVDEIVALIAEASRGGLVNITFTGGEVLARPDKLDAVLRAIDAGRYLIHIQSNAVLLDEAKVRKYRDLGVDKFILSFDPYHETGDWEEMLALRSKQVAMLRRHGMRVIGVAVAARDLIRTEVFQRMVEVTRDLGIMLVFNLPVPLGRWLGNREVTLTEDDGRFIRALVARNPHLRLDFDLNVTRFGCPAFTERFHVNAYGDVQPCTFSQIAFGNIRDESVVAIRERGLRNRVFNVYEKYCPPAEDAAFIAAYTACIKKYNENPVKAGRLFDDAGNLRGLGDDNAGM